MYKDMFAGLLIERSLSLFTDVLMRRKKTARSQLHRPISHNLHYWHNASVKSVPYAADDAGADDEWNRESKNSLATRCCRSLAYLVDSLLLILSEALVELFVRSSLYCTRLLCLLLLCLLCLYDL